MRTKKKFFRDLLISFTEDLITMTGVIEFESVFLLFKENDTIRLIYRV